MRVVACKMRRVQRETVNGTNQKLYRSGNGLAENDGHEIGGQDIIV